MDTHYFRSRDQLSQEFPFKILRYTSQLLKQPLHTHEYIQIAYVLKGVCNHQLRGKSLTVSRGDIFVISPGTEHGISAIEDKEYEMVLLDFMPILVRDQLKPPFSDTLLPLLQQPEDSKNSPLHLWLHISKSKQLLVEHLLQDIQDEFEHREAGYEFAVRISLIKLLIMIDREFRKGRRKPARQPSLANQHPIDEVKRYIYDNFSQDIPLEHGAMIANMAPAYFSHIFKKETGQTFIDFMNEVRIERAMELIRQDSHTITHIGFQVGFHHLSHFIRTFKKRTGITPTEYKKTFGTPKT
ncbi:AraC family transcriptional regulator [Paenibacillus mendelii]|uniref:Helix-turn-helix domain-containing protein n=1 Tax=Paenibacillus mendelii TaxID=206163 RepID=A0ABV6JKP2_9BACL|nr:AraC family transcriptional regulator [Paenibacillus mendelii]MCQ6560676.1 helix-turn-helix domain-containing protein [Paenibacillus mendelii]